MGSVCGIFVGLIKKARFFCGAGKEIFFVARHTHIFMEEWKEKGRILVDQQEGDLSSFCDCGRDRQFLVVWAGKQQWTDRMSVQGASGAWMPHRLWLREGLVWLAEHLELLVLGAWSKRWIDPLPAYLSLIPSSIEINYKTIFEKCLPYGKDGAIIIIGLFWKGGCCCEG